MISALTLGSLIVRYGHGLFGWQEGGLRTAVAIAGHHGDLRSHPPLRSAHRNDRAKGLFLSEGFVFIHEELGTYTQGQLALRMSRPLGGGKERG